MDNVLHLILRHFPSPHLFLNIIYCNYSHLLRWDTLMQRDHIQASSRYCVAFAHLFLILKKEFFLRSIDIRVLIACFSFLFKFLFSFLLLFNYILLGHCLCKVCMLDISCTEDLVRVQYDCIIAHLHVNNVIILGSCACTPTSDHWTKSPLKMPQCHVIAHLSSLSDLAHVYPDQCQISRIHEFLHPRGRPVRLLWPEEIIPRLPCDIISGRYYIG